MTRISSGNPSNSVSPFQKIDPALQEVNQSPAAKEQRESNPYRKIAHSQIPKMRIPIPGVARHRTQTALYELYDDRNIWLPKYYTLDVIGSDPFRKRAGAAQTVWFEAAKLAFLGTTSRELTNEQKTTLEKVLASMKTGETKWSEQQREDFLKGAVALARRSQNLLENKGVGLLSREDRRYGSQSFAEDARLLLLRVDPKALERFDDDEPLPPERKLAQKALAGFALAKLTEKQMSTLFRKVSDKDLIETLDDFIKTNGPATAAHISKESADDDRHGVFRALVVTHSGLSPADAKQLFAYSKNIDKSSNKLNESERKEIISTIAPMLGGGDPGKLNATKLLTHLKWASYELGYSEAILVQRLSILLAQSLFNNSMNE